MNRRYEALKFLVFQQFFRPPHSIIDRRKSVHVDIPCSREVVQELLERMYPILDLWDHNKNEFFTSLCNVLDVSSGECRSFMSEKFRGNLLSPDAWVSLRIGEDQALLLVVGEVYKSFYTKKMQQAYERFGLIDIEPHLGELLSNKYSLINSLLFLNELSIFLNISCSGLQDLIRKLLQYVFSDDEEGFLSLLDKDY